MAILTLISSRESPRPATSLRRRLTGTLEERLATIREDVKAIEIGVRHLERLQHETVAPWPVVHTAAR